jgi:hypothetical protein
MSIRHSSFLLFVALLALVPASVHGQGSIEILDQSAIYSFNNSLHFTVAFQTPAVINEGYVLYQVEGSDRVWVYEGEVSEDQAMEVQVALDAENTIRAFSNITYWFRLGSDHGDFFESQRYSFYYEDNRFGWLTIERPPFTLIWHNGDEAFAASILAAAELGVVRAQSLLPLPDPSAITLRVYDNPADVQLLAQLAGYQWAAGHTDPQYGLILLSLPPGPQQSLEIERQVPHEVAHLMLYQALGSAGYAQLPAWLNEGIASSAELYSDPLQKDLLDVANRSNTLIPFYSLCATFPQDSFSSRLAYAQSASFVSYLMNTYNSVGFGLLVDSYATNPDCLAAPFESFGKDLIALEADWRVATFHANGFSAWLQSSPWTAVLGSAILVTLAFLAIRRVRRAR